MVETSYEQLNEFINRAMNARKYAWEHYDEHKHRSVCYALYGPASSFAGAVTPTHLIPGRERRLVRKTRRKKHNVYELDQNFSPLRVIEVDGDRIYCIYHVFEWNGMVCCCPFKPDVPEFADYRVILFQLSKGKPTVYIKASQDSVFCEFYQYPSNEKRICTGYLYSKNCANNIYGIEPDWNAPFGTPGSPVSKHCYEDVLPELDFSKWFC